MTAIEIENLSKQYALGKIGSGTLYRDLNVWWARMRGKPNPYLKIGQTNDRTQKADGDYVLALQDINLKIEEGDVVGIIGSNGAGKSTLLKILSRVTTPTTGRITTYGRIASLLEVGTGFHPEMTGRENIYMNGAIMGMARSEISRKLDEIVDFAGVAKYIDTPVKRYSSGMTVRLGFAVAAFLEPEILIVDEVLAVGDAEFQKKAIGKMNDVAHEGGRTVLFVSHNMAAVRGLCKRGVVLQNGMQVFDGPVNEAMEIYTNEYCAVETKRIVDGINNRVDGIKIHSISFNGSDLSETTIYGNQDSVEIRIEGVSSFPIDASVKIIFKTLSGTPIMSFAEGRCTGELEHLEGEFTYVRNICLPKYLSQGDYLIDICLHRPSLVDYFYAKDCAMVHIQHSDEINGLPMKLAYEGAFSMVSK